jgi:hypothetical protein
MHKNRLQVYTLAACFAYHAWSASTQRRVLGACPHGFLSLGCSLRRSHHSRSCLLCSHLTTTVTMARHQPAHQHYQPHRERHRCPRRSRALQIWCSLLSKTSGWFTLRRVAGTWPLMAATRQPCDRPQRILLAIGRAHESHAITLAIGFPCM